MDTSIFVRSQCWKCKSFEWTTDMSYVFYCKKCSSPKPCCPVCLKTDVKYICTSINNESHIDVIECLDEDCSYGYPDNEEDEDEVVCLN